LEFDRHAGTRGSSECCGVWLTACRSACRRARLFLGRTFSEAALIKLAYAGEQVSQYG
jgi:hypothetical protein